MAQYMNMRQSPSGMSLVMLMVFFENISMNENLLDDDRYSVNKLAVNKADSFGCTHVSSSNCVFNFTSSLDFSVEIVRYSTSDSTNSISLSSISDITCQDTDELLNNVESDTDTNFSVQHEENKQQSSGTDTSQIDIHT